MAVTKYSMMAKGFPYGGVRSFVVADTEAEMPVTSLMPGDRCFARDTGKTWNWTGSAWNDAAGIATAGPHTHPIADVVGLQTALDGKQNVGGGAESDAVVVQPGDVTITTSTYGTITGLSFPLAANKIYTVEMWMAFTSAALTTGVGVGFTDPAGCVTTMQIMIPPSLSAGTVITQRADDTGIASASVDAIAPNELLLTGHALVRNGANAGTFQLRGKSEVAASAIVFKAGSVLRYRLVN